LYVIITDTQDIHYQNNIVINCILHRYNIMILFEDSLVMIVRHRLSLRRTGNNVFSALNGSASNHNNTIARLFPHESINGYKYIYII